MAAKLFKRFHSPAESREHHTSEIIPVLCKFWAEDGVWNASAVDLAVAAYGKTIKQAQKNLADAIICHLQALQEVGELAREAQRLQNLARDCRLSIEEMSDAQLFGRATAKVSDHKVAVAMCS